MIFELVLKKLCTVIQEEIRDGILNAEIPHDWMGLHSLEDVGEETDRVENLIQVDNDSLEM